MGKINLDNSGYLIIGIELPRRKIDEKDEMTSTEQTHCVKTSTDDRPDKFPSFENSK